MPSSLRVIKVYHFSNRSKDGVCFGKDRNYVIYIYEFIRRQLGCDRTYNHTSLEIGIKEEEKKNTTKHGTLNERFKPD